MSESKSESKDKFKRHTARYRARRRAADILYEAESRDVDPVAIVQDRVALARDNEHGVAPIAEYTQQIVAGAAEELDVIDETIERYLSEDWELFRIPAVDRAILRVGVWELLFNPDVPKVTAVVEGVELASEYSTDAAAPYIHAVLDDVAQATSAGNPMVDAAADDSDEAPEVAVPDESGESEAATRTDLPPQGE
ncbi:transcription antitermination factor NusB [Corynebacterium endometrii]|uniref:Transcription antitermination protein NusB n=1 Tax=Corynebacterium endometrii TaxID=2488819 RepID=A0A4P7QFL2_9CORY|nr:transcription antitermination factor NusB [Corynebacterium endometrii]QCB28521.1 hypothetical protein CENDO_06210 [Corynebacterium endometrii]